MSRRLLESRLAPVLAVQVLASAAWAGSAVALSDAVKSGVIHVVEAPN